MSQSVGQSTMDTEHEITPDLVRRALDGERAAQVCLVDRLTPEIQVNVARMLRRWRTGPAAGRDLRQEVEDMVQEVFLELLEGDGKTLRRWDPDRLPLRAYVGYIARIRTAETLRSRRSPWREDPNPVDDLDRGDPRRSPEQSTLARDRLRKVYLCLLSRFRPADCHLFELLVLRQQGIEEAAMAVGKSADAVYKWRSRLYERARQCRDRLAKVGSGVQDLQVAAKDISRKAP